MEATTVNPYSELLVNVPAPLVNCIKKAADSEAALAWLTSKKPPDPESPSGLNTERRHLREIGEDGEDRWIVWGDEEFNYDNDDNASDAKGTDPVWKEWRYDNDEEDIPDFTEDTEIGIDTEGWNPETDDQLAFRSADATFLSMPDRSKEQEYEMEVPAGSYYCVTGTTTEGRTTYHGLYRLEKKLGVTDSLSPNPAKRIWLNGAAERLLARAL